MPAKKYNTEEERKEARRIVNAKYSAKPENKAKRHTPEGKAARKIANAKYHAKPENKAKAKANDKARHESKKDGIYRVYMLTDGYVGQTDSVYHRMTDHRNRYNRDTSNYIILHECETREEAERIELIYHALGFSGMHKNSSKKVNNVFK